MLLTFIRTHGKRNYICLLFGAIACTFLLLLFTSKASAQFYSPDSLKREAFYSIKEADTLDALSKLYDYCGKSILKEGEGTEFIITLKK